MTTATTTPADTLYHGLFTTALEGGIGYWSACAAYHWSLDGTDYEDDLQGFYADIIELGDDGDYTGPAHTINREVIVRGYRLAISADWRSRLAWSTAKPPIVLTEDSVDDWDYDAGDADMIVQLGLFGKVVYG